MVRENKQQNRESQTNGASEGTQTGAELISSLLLFCFGLFVLLSGLYMCFFAVTGTKVWYYSPGFFPAFVGCVLMLLSIVLLIKKLPAGGFHMVNFRIFDTVDKVKFIRLIVSVVMLAIYVFLLIGRLPFTIATFIYLASSMFVFRSKGFAIWKLLLISLVTTVLVYVFFGVVAGVPLP